MIPVPVENPALQAALMALELRNALGALTETWSRLGHEIGFGIGIAHGFATLGTIGYEGRFDYAAIGTVSNVASRLCDEAKPGQILISARVLTKVENAVQVELAGEFELKGIMRPLAAYNVVAAVATRPTSATRGPQRGNTITLTGLQPENGVTRGTDKVSTSKNNGFAASPNSCGSEACHDRKDTTGFKCDASERSRVPTDKKPSIPPLEVRGKG